MRSQAIVARALRDGVTPIEVMLTNMRFWFENANDIADKLKAMVVDVQDVDSLRELFKMIQTMTAFREKAQGAAVDAAPYIHPRLATISVKGDPDNPVKIDHKHLIEAGKTLKEIAEGYAAALNPDKG